ncbi:hypothetical protein [Cedecea neteri]|uniref:hypothetical protein n=1 Tax=Cedecea TaxID=158483 RepID=UPI0008FF7F5D|nr:hypothetical protein [Cedecea neteri]NWC66083.1 serine acetyltransferase [Cedecea sp. P7760]
MKLLHIIFFLLSKKSGQLKAFWRAEISSNGRINPFRLHIAHKCRDRHFLLWWRLANQMTLVGSKRQRKTAKKIGWALQMKYASDIGLTASIGIKPTFMHLTGVVISGRAVIGDHAVIHQNVTIGVKDGLSKAVANIGHHAVIGAGVCILGGVKIGHHVNIGAMSLVLTDIPDNSTYVCKVLPIVLQNRNSPTLSCAMPDT